jgi:hypothetical protein
VCEIVCVFMWIAGGVGLCVVMGGGGQGLGGGFGQQQPLHLCGHVTPTSIVPVMLSIISTPRTIDQSELSAQKHKHKHQKHLSHGQDEDGEGEE